MRNPFRRRRRLAGAESDWNEDEHIPLGDDYVAVPRDQLPAEALERLEGVTLYRASDSDGGLAVFVDIDAVEAEIDGRVTQLGGPPSDEAMKAIVETAFNNRDHWALDGLDGMADDDTRYSLMRANLLTGRIGGD